MNMDQLAEFEALFGNRHEALALACLHVGGPMRWTDIGHAMAEQAQNRINDKCVTRSLRSLQKRELVTVVEVDGNQLYTLTPRGTERARRIMNLFTRLADDADPQH